ncbi:hypothetical protein BGW39_003194 [Mortierella sp. 14UC]|nr:hypothetical protein BGW39_003194 [Mortierella sp. 14UC]
MKVLSTLAIVVAAACVSVQALRPEQLVKRAEEAGSCQSIIGYLRTSLPLVLSSYQALQKTVASDASKKLMLDAVAEVLFKQLTNASDLFNVSCPADTLILAGQILDTLDEFKDRVAMYGKEDALVADVSRVLLPMAFISLTKPKYIELQCAKPTPQAAPTPQPTP